jgi:hypothetical protein
MQFVKAAYAHDNNEGECGGSKRVADKLRDSTIENQDAGQQWEKNGSEPTLTEFHLSRWNASSFLFIPVSSVISNKVSCQHSLHTAG